MAPPPPRHLLHALGGGIAFGLIEAAAAWLRPWPLDPPVDAGEALVNALALGLLWVGALLRLPRRWGLRGAAAVAAVWALVWGPEGARAMGEGMAVGLLPSLLLTILAARMPRLGLVLGVAGALWTPLARPPTAAAVDRPPGAGPDLLLITVDTVRADVFGPAPVGWSAATVAVAPAPWTLPSLHSLMLGLPVEAHGAGLPVEGGFQARPAGLPSLPDRLAARGYEAVAVLSNPHLRRDNGFADGFSTWMHADAAREPLVLFHNIDGLRARFGFGLERRRVGRDALAEAAALRILGEKADHPRFVWVHLLGPHEYGRALEDPLPGWFPGTTDPALRRRAYAQAVATARARALRLAAAAPGAQVIITADHGEAFGEDGHEGHGSALDAAQLEVPLWARGLDVACPVARLDRLADLLLGAGGVCADEVPVAGLRRDRAAAALRSVDGRYLPARSVAPAGPAEPLDGETRDALRAIGYIVGD